jgi:hypothetical protein
LLCWIHAKQKCLCGGASTTMVRSSPRHLEWRHGERSIGQPAEETRPLEVRGSQLHRRRSLGDLLPVLPLVLLMREGRLSEVRLSEVRRRQSLTVSLFTTPSAGRLLFASFRRASGMGTRFPHSRRRISFDVIGRNPSSKLLPSTTLHTYTTHGNPPTTFPPRPSHGPHDPYAPDL